MSSTWKVIKTGNLKSFFVHLHPIFWYYEKVSLDCCRAAVFGRRLLA